MGSKSSANRKFEIDLVQLHHATGRQRDELVAQLLYTVVKKETGTQPVKKRRPAKHRPTDEEKEVQ